MNAEIVRVLENEFPEPWPLEKRVSELVEMVAVIKEGASNEILEKLVDELEETIQGIKSKRVGGLSDEVRRAIEIADLERQERLSEEYNDLYYGELDEEEATMLNSTGRTQKFTHNKEENADSRDDAKKPAYTKSIDDDLPL